MKRSNLFRLFLIVGIMILAGAANSAVAQNTSNGGYTVVTNAGFTGMFVEGADGSHHFRGAETINDVVTDDDVINLGGGLCGVRVYGRGELSNEYRVRAFNCPTEETANVEVVNSSEDGQAQPPYSCYDDQGRMRSNRPCRGN